MTSRSMDCSRRHCTNHRETWRSVCTKESSTITCQSSQGSQSSQKLRSVEAFQQLVLPASVSMARKATPGPERSWTTTQKWLWGPVLSTDLFQGTVSVMKLSLNKSVFSYRENKFYVSWTRRNVLFNCICTDAFSNTLHIRKDFINLRNNSKKQNTMRFPCVSHVGASALYRASNCLR